MTQPPVDLQDHINRLSKSNKVPNPANIERRIERIQRMAAFYERKAPDSADGGALFLGFASALTYANTILRMYNQLTQELAELAEVGNETRTDSES